MSRFRRALSDSYGIDNTLHPNELLLLRRPDQASPAEYHRNGQARCNDKHHFAVQQHKLQESRFRAHDRPGWVMLSQGAKIALIIRITKPSSRCHRCVIKARLTTIMGVTH